MGKARVATRDDSVRDLRALYVKKRDVWISRVVYSRLSIPIVWALLRTPATPNGVTWTSGVAGLGGLAIIAAPGAGTAAILAGLFLLQIGFVLDHADGQLARAKGLASPGGVFLDGFVMEVVVQLAVAVAFPLFVYHTTGDPVWLWMLIAFLFSKALNTATYMHKAAMAQRFRPPPDPAYRDPLGPRPVHVLALERYWETKKFGNLASILVLGDLALRARGIGPWFAAGHEVTLVAGFIALGIPALLVTTFVDSVRASRGRLYVDLEPFG